MLASRPLLIATALYLRRAPVCPSAQLISLSPNQPRCHQNMKLFNPSLSVISLSCINQLNLFFHKNILLSCSHVKIPSCSYEKISLPNRIGKSPSCSQSVTCNWVWRLSLFIFYIHSELAVAPTRFSPRRGAWPVTSHTRLRYWGKPPWMSKIHEWYACITQHYHPKLIMQNALECWSLTSAGALMEGFTSLSNRSTNVFGISLRRYSQRATAAHNPKNIDTWLRPGLGFWSALLQHPQCHILDPTVLE